MSGESVAMMIVAILIIWGGLAAALISLHRADRRRRDNA
jgi:Putative methionine and alanine importer, small subunit